MHFIVNKIGGSGVSGENFEFIRRELDSRGVGYTFDYTDYPNHATELAKAAADRGENLIAAVGGDGTVREVINGMADSGATLGIFPFGSGNDFVKPLGIPTEPIEALECFLAGHVKKVDIARCNGRIFDNIAGIGFDVAVLDCTEKFKRKLNGMLPYFLGIMEAMFTRKKLNLRIELDDTTVEGTFLMVDVANGTHFGGGMKAAPHADPCDGLFDVVVIKYVNFFRFLTLLPGFIKGKHVEATKVVTEYRSKTCKITATDGKTYRLQNDGEREDALITPATLEIMHEALNLIVPEKI